MLRASYASSIATRVRPHGTSSRWTFPAPFGLHALTPEAREPRPVLCGYTSLVRPLVGLLCFKMLCMRPRELLVPLRRSHVPLGRYERSAVLRDRQSSNRRSRETRRASGVSSFRLHIYVQVYLLAARLVHCQRGRGRSGSVRSQICKLLIRGWASVAYITRALSRETRPDAT